MAQSRRSRFCSRQLASQRHRRVLQRAADRRRHLLLATDQQRPHAALRVVLRGVARSDQNGSFDPSVDSFFVPYGSGPFPLQGTGTALNGLGNETRYNPKVRLFPNLNENLRSPRASRSAKSSASTSVRKPFNVFNRVRFGTGSTQLQSTTFGKLTSNGDLLNTPRQMQLAAKLYF